MYKVLVFLLPLLLYGCAEKRHGELNLSQAQLEACARKEERARVHRRELAKQVSDEVPPLEILGRTCETGSMPSPTPFGALLPLLQKH